MTTEQKKRIATMRNQGCTYAKIAETLSIPKNTVKTCCRRARLSEETTNATPVCKQCDKPIAMKGKHRARQFCSDKCRAAWWYANHKGKAKTEYHLTCANCGKPFIRSGNKARKYCSHQCYISARFGGGCHE